MQVRNAVSSALDWMSIQCRRLAGSVYPDNHPLHTFNHEVANSIRGVQRAYLRKEF